MKREELMQPCIVYVRLLFCAQFENILQIPYSKSMIAGTIELIAEVKTHSPFGWKSDKSWDELFALAHKVGDMISVHTDARWGGLLTLLRRARMRAEKPILAKGIHATDKDIADALACGANWVLMVGRIPEAGRERCMIEPLTLSQIREIPAGCRVAWNSRDLATGGLKEERFSDARRLWGGWLAQTSNIRTIENIEEGANAVLVGTHLAQFAASASLL